LGDDEENILKGCSGNATYRKKAEMEPEVKKLLKEPCVAVMKNFTVASANLPTLTHHSGNGNRQIMFKSRGCLTYLLQPLKMILTGKR
jgi:hypothetical protein